MLVENYLNSIKGKPLAEVNALIKDICGVVNFFENEDYSLDIEDRQTNRVEYGDWQTNFDLAKKSCMIVKDNFRCPEIIIEPTCGTGVFILASIAIFGKSLKKIIGIEIFKPYLHQLKYSLLEYGLKFHNTVTYEIELIHQSIFDIDLRKFEAIESKRILILGNLPWVTNSQLSKISSNNLPAKSNFKNAKGIDAITGKSNFDIAESIIYRLLDTFQHADAYLAILIKSSVAKNIVYEQKKEVYRIASIHQYQIDAKRSSVYR